MQGKVPINLSDTNTSAIVWSPWLHNSTVEKSLESTCPIFKFFDSSIWVIHVHESELIVSRSCLAYLCKTKLPSYELYMYSFLILNIMFCCSVILGRNSMYVIFFLLQKWEKWNTHMYRDTFSKSGYVSALQNSYHISCQPISLL